MNTAENLADIYMDARAKRADGWGMGAGIGAGLGAAAGGLGTYIASDEQDPAMLRKKILGASLAGAGAQPSRNNLH